MSARVVLVCDDCGQEFPDVRDAGVSVPSVVLALALRTAAGRSGWEREAGRDSCEKCAERKKGVKR